MPDISSLLDFDENWAERVRELDRYRMRENKSLSELQWAIVCDVSDELSQVPGVYGSGFSDEAKKSARVEVVEIYKYFLRRVKELESLR